jgi:DNA mismatch repair ATPase MutS
MYPDQDFDPEQLLINDSAWRREQKKPPLTVHQQALIQDLALKTLLQAMALDDKLIFDVSQQAILSSVSDLDVIRYRQSILQDCLQNAAIVREIYQISLQAIANKRRSWLGIYSSYPSGILSGALQMVHMLMEWLKKVKQIADKHAAQFQSEGFTRFFAMIQTELDDDYFALVQGHLRELAFNNGVLLSAVLGKGNEGENYILRKPHKDDRNWLERVFVPRTAVFTYRLHPRDDHGARALGEMKNQGVNLVANALAQSADHIESFFKMLQIELAFYVGCLNLAEQLGQISVPYAFPVPAASHERCYAYQGLYDVCLALTMKQKIVSNEGTADGKDLVMITGANQGGKSTFLRSVGLAQLMMQCGLFVPATSFRANVCDGVFTHFKREEDATMTSGKLDEELGRMSEIVDAITPDSLLLFNESFAATNEREGSEIGRQIVSALLEKRIKVFFVTHLYEFARGFYDQGMVNTLFLRAERKADGRRTFKLIVGEPLQTSYGGDLFKQVFGTDN